MVDTNAGLNALVATVVCPQESDEIRTEAALRVARHCISSSQNLEDVEVVVPTIIEVIASGKGEKPAAAKLIAACASVRLTHPKIFVAASPSKKGFPWPPRNENGMMTVAHGLAQRMSDDDVMVQAGAFMGAGALAWRDARMSLILSKEPGVISSATRLLNAAASLGEGLLECKLMCACATAAACMLGLIVMLERAERGPTRCSSLPCADEALDHGVAESIVVLLWALVPALNAEQLDSCIVHCIYQVTFLIQVLGGASAPLREILVGAGVAEPLVEAMENQASFGDSLTISARATLAVGALFGPDGKPPDNVDVQVDIDQARKLCQFFNDSLAGRAPLTPWLIARDIGKLANDSRNRANLRAAGIEQLLAKGVKGSEDAQPWLARETSSNTMLNMILTERWCARALVSMCVKDQSRVALLLPNACTFASLFCGFYAVLAGSAQHTKSASIAIILAASFDLLDGKVAQMVGSRSQFGEQYEILTDMVAFGIAPAMSMFNSLLSNRGALGIFATFSYIAATGVRLARCVATPPSSRFVYGLPSNVAALVMVATSVTCPWCLPDSDGLRAFTGIGVSILSSIGMISTFRQRNFLPDFHLKRALQALVLVVIATLLALVMPPEQVMLAAAAIWAALVFQLKEHKQFLLALTLVCGFLAAALSLSDRMLPNDDPVSNGIFAVVMLVWEPFTRTATFAAFLKVKSAQNVLATHWVRQATGLDFHHFHLGVVLLVLAMAIRPFIVSVTSLRALAACVGIGLSYVLDQAVPVLVKTFGRDKHLSVRPCIACGRKRCPWRWGTRGLCYFAREATIAAAVLHAIAIWWTYCRIYWLSPTRK